MKARALWLVLWVMIACAGAAPAGAQADPFPRTVVDAARRQVTIAAPPQIILTLGDDPALDWVIPGRLRRPLDPDAADPAELARGDLVILPAWALGALPDLMAATDRAGAPVFVTDAVTSLGEWRTALTRLGRVTGQEGRAARAVAWLDIALGIVRRRVEGAPAVRVLVLTPEGYTFGRGTLVADLIAAAGGVNAAASYDDYRQIDDTTIQALAPDVIALKRGWDRSQIAALLANPAYAALPAFREGRVWQLPFSATAPPDPGAAVMWLAARLHPNAFPEWMASPRLR